MTKNKIGRLFGNGEPVIDFKRQLANVIGCLLLASSLLATPVASAREVNSHSLVDTNALVRKMMTVYQSAQAFEETSEAKIKVYGKPDYIQSTTLRFKRPNLIFLSSEDPSIGTYQSFCNGKTISIYTGAQNVYTRRNSPVNLRQTMARMSSAGKALMGIDIVQMLSPISFISARGMPDECKNFRFVRADVLNGNKVAVVTGQATAEWLVAAGIPKQTIFDHRDVTLWIDTDQYLLRKASCDLRWHVNVAASSNMPAHKVPGSLIFEEIHRASRLNPPLRDEDFFFTSPKGAAERYQENQ